MVAVTGATGHLGINLVRELVGAGRQVRTLVYEPSQALEKLAVETVRGDVRDLDSLVSAFSGAEVVYHLAARIDLTKRNRVLCNAVNVTGTQNVLEACRQSRVKRLIYFSSIHALSPFPVGETIDETRPLATAPYQGVYDQTKAIATGHVLKATKDGLDAVVVMPTGVLGPHDHEPSRMGRLFIDLKRNKLPAVLPGGFNWVDARDVCQGAIAAEERGESGTAYILSGHWCTFTELLEVVSDVASMDTPHYVVPRRLASFSASIAEIYSWFRREEPRLSRYTLRTLQHHKNITNNLARQTLGFDPRPIQETIFDTLEWHESAGNF